MSEDKYEKSKQDEAIKEFCNKDAIKDASKVSNFLKKVALDDAYRDKKMIKVKVWDDKDKNEFHYELEEQDIPVSVNIRVTAAKTWKEMIFDKAVGDVKEKAKESRREGIDMRKAAEAIAKAKAAERSSLKEEAL